MKTTRGFIFLVGIGQRSGTNYVGRALLAHRAVVRPEGYFELPLLRSGAQFEEFAEHFAGRTGRARLGYGAAEVEQAFGAGFLDLVWSRVPDGADGSWLLLKTPFPGGLEYFRRFFPEGRLVVLVRDPADLVASQLAAHAVASGPRRLQHVALFAHRYRAAARRIASYPGPMYLLQYEDVVNDAERALAPLSTWIGLPGDDGWFERVHQLPVTGSTHFRGQGVEQPGQAGWQALEPDSSFRPVGRGSRNLSSTELALVRTITAPSRRRLADPELARRAREVPRRASS